MRKYIIYNVYANMYTQEIWTIDFSSLFYRIYETHNMNINDFNNTTAQEVYIRLHDGEQKRLNIIIWLLYEFY